MIVQDGITNAYNTHQITLGGKGKNPITFEVTNGLEVMKRLLDDFTKLGANIIASDENGFCAELNGQQMAYTMIELFID